MALLALIFIALVIWALLFAKKNEATETSWQFAQYLVVDNNPQAAYELVSDRFRQATTLEQLTEHGNRMQGVFGGNISLEFLYSSDNNSGMETSVYGFSFETVEWQVSVVTYTLNGQTFVQRYSVDATGASP